MAAMLRTSGLGQAMDGTQVSITQLTFNKHDTDGNKTLCKTEFKAMIYSLGRYLDDTELEAAFTFVELNGDGRITYQEFLVWWLAEDRWGLLVLSEEQLTALNQVSDVFQYYDSDLSGKLDVAQFSETFKYLEESGYNLQGQSEEEILPAIDTSGDGEINFNEFISWMVDVGVLEAQGIKRTDLEEKEIRRLSKLPDDVEDVEEVEVEDVVEVVEEVEDGGETWEETDQ